MKAVERPSAEDIFLDADEMPAPAFAFRLDGSTLGGETCTGRAL